MDGLLKACAFEEESDSVALQVDDATVFETEVGICSNKIVVDPLVVRPACESYEGVVPVSVVLGRFDDHILDVGEKITNEALLVLQLEAVLFTRGVDGQQRGADRGEQHEGGERNNNPKPRPVTLAHGGGRLHAPVLQQASRRTVTARR